MKITRDHRPTPLVSIVGYLTVAGFLLLPKAVLGVPPLEPVEVTYKSVGEIDVSLQTSDIEYVELVRHVYDPTVFDPVTFGELATSPPHYLVAADIETSVANLTVVPALGLSKEKGGTVVPLTIPIPVSLGTGAFCETMEVTVLRKERPPRIVKRGTCFQVDDTGSASMLTAEEISAILFPPRPGLNAEGVVVPEVSGIGIPYGTRGAPPKEIGFDTPEHGGGLLIASPGEHTEVGQ